METQKKKKIILDLDTGIDDALALSYAIGRPDIELLGVTNVFGNVTVDEAVRNTLDFLHLLKRPDIPVYRGAACALHGTSYEPPAICRDIHGKNGIGNISIGHSSKKAEETDAVDFLLDSIHRYGKELTIVATSPLTNIAMALERDHEIADLLGNLVIMGGAVTVPGNVTPFAEANILGDTPAAKAVLASRFQITLVGLDVTLRTLLTRSETRQIRSWGTPQAIQIADMIEYYFRAYQGKMTGIAGCPLHDPLAVGIAVDRSLATVLPLCLTVDTEGPSIGRTVGDVERLAEPQPNVQVCIGVDGGRYVDSFMEVLKSLVGGQVN